eukprot:gene5455-5855_t
MVIRLVLLFNLLLVGIVESWHAYDRRKHELLKRNVHSCQKNYTLNNLLDPAIPNTEDQSNEETSDTCPCYHEATRSYPKEFIQKLSLWPNLMTQYDEENGETIYASKIALDLIWENQNPPDCTKAQYIISGGWPYGFGSRIHMEGLVLALAVQLGRVYLPHPDGDNIFWETKVPFCQQSQHDETLTCFYEKLSKCTIQDALVSTAFHDVNGFPTFSLGDFHTAFESEDGLHHIKETMASYKGLNVIMTSGKVPYDGHKYIPHQVFPLLHCSPMKEDFFYYWWRAISATFIARPNLPTRNMLASLHTNEKFRHEHDSQGCIAMFVRHGDKGIDMKLLEFSEYAKVANDLWQRGLVPQSYNYLKKHHDVSANKSAVHEGVGHDHQGDVDHDHDHDHNDDRSHHHHHHNEKKKRYRGRRLQQQQHQQQQGRSSLRGGGANIKRGLSGGNATNDSENSQEHEQEHDHDHGLDEDHNHEHDHDHDHSHESADNTDWGNHFYDHSHSLPMNGTLFITTEDPKVLDEADRFGKENHWKIIYTNLFDRAQQTAYKTWNEQHKRGSVAVHDNLEYLSMLYNLLLSSQCEAWVCTLASNSCRIMDEIRATVGGKANRHFADISKESCDDLPCVADHGTIKTFGE